jgi:exosortase A-associated hydrolase 1
MSRQHYIFKVGGDRCVATLDSPATGASGKTGLFIVSGGNEIRSGAHGGQAAMAAYFAAKGFPIWRYDRRGIGDSEGENGGFEGSENDIEAAIHAFRAAAPALTRIVAFGNCDAASALALFHGGQMDALLLANPWVIENAASADNSADTPVAPNAAAIRARYWARIKNPRSLIDLLTGKINVRKLLSGLAKAAAKEEISGLALRIRDALNRADMPVHILLAERDSTAMAFKGAWSSAAFQAIKSRVNITIASTDSASHSFADEAAQTWLYAQILDALVD